MRRGDSRSTSNESDLSLFAHLAKVALVTPYFLAVTRGGMYKDVELSIKEFG